MNTFRISNQKMIGIFLFLLGIFIMFYSGAKFTGFAVFLEGSGRFFLIGIMFVIGGIILMNFSRKSKLEIKLYRESNKNGKGQIYMTDPENLFGKNGAVTLEQFRKDMKEIKKDPELLELVKDAYFVPLMDKSSNDEENTEAELAKQYLVEMGFKSEQENEGKYALPKMEIIRIKNAFGERKDKITPAQKKVLKDYNLKYTSNGNRVAITPENGGKRVIIGISPSDINAGKRISSLILKLCDSQYRKK